MNVPFKSKTRITMPGISITRVAIGLGTSGGRTWGTFTETLVNRFEVPVSDAVKDEIKVFFDTLEANSLTTKVKALYNFWIHDEQAAQQNWISDTDNLSEKNGPLYFLAKWGIKGTGLASGPCWKMQSNLDDLIDNNDYSLGAYIESRQTLSFFMGAYDGTGSNWLLGYDNDGATYIAFYDNGSILADDCGVAPFMVSTTRNGNLCNIYKDGVAFVTTDTDAPSILPAYPMFIMGRNNSGNNEASYSGRLSFWYISSKLTEAEHLIIHNAYQTWKTNVATLI